jgi:translation initiation factor IF-1
LTVDLIGYIIIATDKLKRFNLLFFVKFKNFLPQMAVEENKQQANSKDFIEVVGEVIELMPGASFKVRLQNEHEVLAHLSGRMRMNKIRLAPGDKVRLEMSPYDLTKGRVIYRL